MRLAWRFERAREEVTWCQTKSNSLGNLTSLSFEAENVSDYILTFVSLQDDVRHQSM